MYDFSAYRDKALYWFCTLQILLLGRWSPTLQVLVLLMFADYISGITLAWHRHSLSSRIGASGIARKIAMLGLVALGHQADTVMGTSLLRDVCALFYVANEALSITENCASLGIPLPKVLIQALHHIKSEADSDKISLISREENQS